MLIKVKSTPDIVWLGALGEPIHSSGHRNFKTRVKRQIEPSQILLNILIQGHNQVILFNFSLIIPISK